MEREQEIRQASYIIANKQVSSCNFILGAQWADEHPNKNLVNIDKVIKWLRDQKEMIGISFEEDFYIRLKEDLTK